MKPCKHLDHDPSHYPTCVLKTLDSFSIPVTYFERQELPYPDAPRNVQFCGQGRGRINSIFACYNEGEMHCYQPAYSLAPSAEPKE